MFKNMFESKHQKVLKRLHSIVNKYPKAFGETSPVPIERYDQEPILDFEMICIYIQDNQIHINQEIIQAFKEIISIIGSTKSSYLEKNTYDDEFFDSMAIAENDDQLGYSEILDQADSSYLSENKKYTVLRDNGMSGEEFLIQANKDGLNRLDCYNILRLVFKMDAEEIWELHKNIIPDKKLDQVSRPRVGIYPEYEAMIASGKSESEVIKRIIQDGNNRIKCIKILRGIYGWDLEEAIQKYEKYPIPNI